ncbi:hypothetical protein D9M73_290950 [compost metagenome]
MQPLQEARPPDQDVLHQQDHDQRQQSSRQDSDAPGAVLPHAQPERCIVICRNLLRSGLRWMFEIGLGAAVVRREQGE